MWIPPDESPSPASPSAEPGATSDDMSMAVTVRPSDWPTPEELIIWAQMPEPPRNGPANASIICGVTSLLLLCALVVMAVIFTLDTAHNERLLLASVVVAEEGLIPSVLAIYFGHLSHDERYEPLLTEAGWVRAKFGVIFGYVAIVSIAAGAIALLLASSH